MSFSTRLYALAFALMVVSTANADDYVYGSTAVVSSNYGSSLKSIACDNGNTYAGGWIKKTSNTDSNLYVIAQGPAGGQLWTKEIATNGTGINSCTKMIARDGGVYIGGTVYYSVSGVSHPHAYLARLNPTNGAVLWEKSIPDAVCTDVAYSNAQVMIGASENKPGQPTVHRYAALQVSDDGTTVVAFRASTFDGTSVIAVGGLPNSFVAIIDKPASADVVATQLLPNSFTGWTTSVARGGGWETLRMDTCDPADNVDGAAIGLTGWYQWYQTMAFSSIRLKADGTFLNETYTDMFPTSAPVPPSWDRGRLFTAFANTPSGTYQKACVNISTPTTSSDTLLESVEGSVTPAALGIDGMGCPHVVEKVYEPLGSAPKLRVVSPNGGVCMWETSYSNVLPTDVKSNHQGSIYISALHQVSGVWLGELIRLQPRPSAGTDLYELNAGKTLTVSGLGVLENDFGTEFSSVAFSNPGSGTLTPQGGGAFSYTPDQNFTGDTFSTYQVTTALGTSVGNIRFRVFPKMKKVELSQTQVVGGQGLTGTITMTGAMPADGTIDLSDNSTATNTPANVAIPYGGTLVTFPITTSPVGSDKVVTITAKFRGTVWSQPLTVKASTLKAIAVNPNSVKGGGNFNLSVSFTGVLGADATVNFAHTGNEISIPVLAVFHPGAQVASFQGHTVAVSHSIQRSVSASCGGITKTVTMTINP